MSQPIIIKDINSRVYKPLSVDNRIVKFDGANGDIQNSSVYLLDDGSFDSVKGLFLKNRNDGATSTNRFGMYLLDDKVEFTYRDNSNSYLGNAFHININDGTTTFPSKINFNNNIYLENENPIRSVIHRKKAGGGGWAYNPLILQGDDGVKFANIGAYGTENALGYMFMGPGEWDSDLNLKVFLNGTVKAKSIETTTLSVTDSLTISNATYNKSLSIGHGANDAFWYNSKSGKYVQHKDDGTFSFAGNQILDAGNYTNYAVKKAYSDKVPFALSNNLFTVNKTLNWNASSYYKWVYLLLPCLTATNYSGDNIFDGEFYLYKNGACIFDIVHVRMNCIYNNMVYNIQSTGDYSTGWKIVRCKYGGIWYYALEGTYHANPYNRTHFFGHVKSDLNGGLAQLALPYTVAYYNDNTKTVLNSEIYNSLTTTLTDTYCTYVYKHKTYMNTSLITEYGTTDYTTNKVRNTAANTSLGSLGNGDTYLVYA